MKNLSFAAIVGAVVLASLGAAAVHYQSPVAVRAAVVVYHDNALLPGQTNHSSDRFWTAAVRSDGATVQANAVPDINGHIQGVRSIELQDRYVVVDPSTMSVSTYRPYRQVVVGTRDCSGKSAGTILGHPVEYMREEKPASAPSGWIRERWLATDLNCLFLREHVVMTEHSGKQTEFFREAVSVKLGEPPAEYFDIPSNYQERGPAQVNSEVEKRSPGHHVVSNPEMLQKMQHVYETDKPK